MGAGKTSVGKALAGSLHWRFLDLDEVVVAREGRTVAEIFGEHGEQGFRARESAALQELLHELGSASDNTVLALGGGAVMSEQNRDVISTSRFPVFFLDAHPKQLFERCQSQRVERPLLTDFVAFEELHRSREPQYASLGSRVETEGRSVQQVAQHIERLLGLAEEQQ